MVNLNWEKIHSIILFVTCHGLRNFPLLIHIPLYPFVNFWNPMSYYFLSLSFDPPHPTPTWHTPPYPTPSWPNPFPPLYDTPHPPLHDPSHLTPPHPFMTHPSDPTPSLHDPPTPPHPFMTQNPPHPTPPLVYFWAQRSLFSWVASLCLPLVDNYLVCWFCTTKMTLYKAPGILPSL